MNNGNTGHIERLVIRAGSHSLAFLKPSPQHYPYAVESGMSVAANLRKAFREEEYLREEDAKALLSVVSPTVLVPIDEYMDGSPEEMAQLYHHAITGHEKEEVVASVLPDLNVVALFAVNKDLLLVVNDRFADVRVQNVMQPVWQHLYKRSMLTTQRRKLYAYFHDGMVDIFAFMQRRFRYANTFEVGHAHDALYYILYVWKQMGLDPEADELHIVGKMLHHDWLDEKLKQFLRRIYTINPVADLNRAPVSLIKDLEYDMML